MSQRLIIASWAQRVAKEAFEQDQSSAGPGRERVTIHYEGIKWVIQVDLAIPAVVTVK